MGWAASPDSLHKREAELKAKAQTLTAEYVRVERQIAALPARKRHPQQAPPFSVGSGGVTQQEPPPERRRGWLRRLFSRQ